MQTSTYRYSLRLHTERTLDMQQSRFCWKTCITDVSSSSSEKMVTVHGYSHKKIKKCYLFNFDFRFKFLCFYVSFSHVLWNTIWLFGSKHWSVCLWSCWIDVECSLTSSKHCSVSNLCNLPFPFSGLPRDWRWNCASRSEALELMLSWYSIVPLTTSPTWIFTVRHSWETRAQEQRWRMKQLSYCIKYVVTSHYQCN